MKREKITEKERTTQMDAVSKTLSSIYTGVFLIDLIHDTYSVIKGTDAIGTILEGITSAQEAINMAIKKTVFEDEILDMLTFVNLTTLSSRMGKEKILNTEYMGIISGWVRGSFMEVQRDQNEKLTQVLYVYQVIDDDKRKELDHLQELKNNYEISEKENREGRKKNAELEADKLFLKDANTELQRARDAVQMILKSGSYLCAYADDGETLISIKYSDALRKLYGYSDREDTSDTWEMWLKSACPEDREYVNTSYRAALLDRTGNTKYDVTYRALRKDGTLCWHRAAAYIIRRADGTAEFSYGLVMDVNEQKNAEDKVKEALRQAEIANEAKTSFLARMSHDIRTPMNGIMGLIEINERHAEDVEFTSRNRRKAKVAADHLLSLINEVLQLSKLEDPVVELSNEPFDLQELSKDVLIIIEQRAKERGITVKRDDDPSVLEYPYVYGSPLHVKQIFINILGNAIKYNKDNGSILCHAEMERKEDEVLFKVDIKDTGIGMSEEFLAHLFEPFAREQEEIEGGLEGTGLGMSIVKRLIDKMGGTIQVNSIPDIGSCFTVELPFKIASKDVLEKDTEEENLPKDISGTKILLVEDNELNMDIAEIILSDAGAKVTKAVNGQQAVDIFEENIPGTFDVILMDVMMPVMNGYEATRKIRSLEREDAKEIPIIAITANAFTEDVESAINAGMNDHLAKPLNVQKMIFTIAKYVKK